MQIRLGLHRSPLLLAAAALALSGCQTYTQQTQSRDNALRTGDIATAVSIANRDAEKNARNKDTVLYRLEQGAILRAAAIANLPLPPEPASAANTAGQTQTNQALNAVAPAEIPPRIAWITRSIAAFDEAIRRIDDYEAEARIKVGSEVGAMLTNQANTPYRGRAYDKVMLHTYQALNYLQLADADAARVELNRALQRQRDAVEANAKRIEEAQRLAEDAKSGSVTDDQGRQGSYDIDRALANPATASGIRAIESKFNASILPYGDYVNPFTTFLDALVFTHQGSDGSDLERARKSWERVINFAPNNPYAREDYVSVEPDLRPASATPTITVVDNATDAPANDVPSVAAHETPAVAADTPLAPAALPAAAAPASGGVTYVIFETGSAPYREQLKIDLPIFAFTNSISYVGMALPQIETVDGHARSLTVGTSDGRTYPVSLVASMDSVVAQDFKNEWPSILTKAIISTGTKATIDAILQKQIEDQAGPTGALLFKLATAVTQAAINIADTRTWRSLPKEFHYARLPTPPDRQLLLSTGTVSTSVTLEPAAVQVVYVKSPGGFSPIFATQFILKN